MEFLKLKHQYKSYQIYPQIDLYLESFLKRGLREIQDEQLIDLARKLIKGEGK
jgi:hypothetical protein